MNKNTLIIFLIFSIVIVSVSAKPQIPTQYYGVVSQDGNSVEGKTVEVKDESNNYVSVSIQDTDSEGIYVVHVIWDDPETGIDEGVIAGELISFYIDDNKIKEISLGNNGDILEEALAISGTEITSPSFERTMTSDNNGEISITTVDDEGKDSDPTPNEENKNNEENLVEQKLENENDLASENKENIDEKSNTKFNIGNINFIFILLGLAVLIIILFSIKKKGLKGV